ncbi:uncharacterized protein TNCV_147401 [Trichonephila clavipes]|nr:uncharacterized protein TNCV_147401 [Trichonephila clavipes]
MTLKSVTLHPFLLASSNGLIASTHMTNDYPICPTRLLRFNDTTSFKLLTVARNELESLNEPFFRSLKDSRLNRFVEWAQNEIAIVPDFHKRIFFSDEAHFCLNGYVNQQNCRIWSEANPQVYVETPLHPEKLTVWCALWAGGILLQKR